MTEPPLYRYEVGKPYSPSGRTIWPETPHLRLTPAGCELTLFYASPTDAEIADTRLGTARFAWVSSGSVAVLCYRLGAGPWADVPYMAGLERERAGVGGDEWRPGLHVIVTVILVDAATGIIRAIRAVSWPPRFVRIVRDSLTAQLAAPFNRRAADAELGQLYNMGDSQWLAEHMPVATCRGGAPELSPWWSWPPRASGVPCR